MTSPEQQPGGSSGESGTPGTPGTPSQPTYADRVYRSPMAMVGGALLLAVGVWMGGDALIRGEGRVPWVAAALLVLGVPLVVAFTFRPAVYANEDRLKIRNPFRTIELPWASLATLRASYSTEALTQDGTKYQVWAIPVSLRSRRKALRSRSEDVAGSERTLHDLRELAERSASRPTAQGTPQVRWAYEILAPLLVGLVALAALAATA